MIFNRAKKYENELNNFSPTSSFEDRKSGDHRKKPNTPMQIENSNHGFNTTGFSRNRSGYRNATEADSESVGPATAEIKTRVETVLSRIKSEAAMSEIDDAKAANKEDIGSLKPGEESTNSPAIAGSSSIKSVKAELERRREELFALAREAENKAREAEEKYKEVENKLEQETEKRLAAEQRFRELEEEQLQRLSATEAAELKLLEAQVALEESEGRLKEAENLIKKTEARVEEEAARRAQAESKAEAAALALAEADQRSSEAETRAQTAEENAREIEALITEAESIALATHEKYKTTEARLKDEIERRILTEQQLNSFGAEITSYLELNWTRSETGEPQMGIAPPNVEARDILQIREQFENEQKARLAAEKSCAEFEAKLVDLEEKLSKAEERNRQAQTAVKKGVREQEAPLPARTKVVARTNEFPTEYSFVKSAEDNSIMSMSEQIEGANRIKLLSYSAVIALLLLALCWLAVEAYHQL